MDQTFKDLLQVKPDRSVLLRQAVKDSLVRGAAKDPSVHSLRVETSISTLPWVAELSPVLLKGTTAVVVSGRVEASAMGHPLQGAEVFPDLIKAAVLAMEVSAFSRRATVLKTNFS